MMPQYISFDVESFSAGQYYLNLCATIASGDEYIVGFGEAIPHNGHGDCEDGYVLSPLKAIGTSASGSQ
jgi:hypothetical protein